VKFARACKIICAVDGLHPHTQKHIGRAASGGALAPQLPHATGVRPECALRAGVRQHRGAKVEGMQRVLCFV